MATRRHRTGSHHRPALITTLPWWMEAAEPSCFEHEHASSERALGERNPSAQGTRQGGRTQMPLSGEAKVSTRGAGWATPSSPRAARCMEMIRALVEAGRYEFGAHVQSHMIEEGFDKEHCVGSVLGGRVLEVYVPPQQRRERERFLVVGRFHLSARNTCPLHVVCEFFLPPAPCPKAACHKAAQKIGSQWAESSPLESEEQVRFVTAYIPRPPEWVSPHVRAPRS